MADEHLLQYAFQDTDLPLNERREGAKQSKNKELSRFLYSTRGYSVDLTFDRWGLPPVQHSNPRLVAHSHRHGQESREDRGFQTL